MVLNKILAILKKVHIPQSVVDIEDMAFNCSAKIIICAAPGGVAEQYAKNHNMSFKAELLFTGVLVIVQTFMPLHKKIHLQLEEKKMQECINFQMQVKKKIPEVMEFATKKLVNDKMKSYCGSDETAIEQFGWWCSEYVTIDKAKGIIDAGNDTQMWYDNIYILQGFVKDIAQNIPDSEFSGSIEKNNDEIGTEITIEFKMKKGKLEFEDIYPEGYYGYGEYDEEEDYN